MKKLAMLAAVAIASGALAMTALPNLLDRSDQPAAARAQAAAGQTVDHSQLHTGHQMGKGDLLSMLGGLETMRGQELDRAFLSMMIPHHQAAVEMSQEILKTTQDAQVRAWAKAIVAAQNAEISRMTLALEAYGGPDSQMAAKMDDMMAGMVSEIRSAQDKDAAFVRGMIPHHGSAVMMAGVALLYSANPEVLALARDIARAQAQEIHDFQLYLLDHAAQK
ncbi:DUF305 domain-containing protein [Deinococcus lacus]|uniref:DUF305 domain-containing protein n=1 Tax=Deinococcus lacus TaxID=392561 RepID=A0ABW1YHC4_9DEIO